jgi:hypothetical protein
MGGLMAHLATYTCLAEPRGKPLRDLITASLLFSDRMGFVVRDTMPTSARLHALLRQLEADLDAAGKRNEWPGTRLLGGLATVYEYRWNDKTAALIANAATGLYSWVQPHLPEDVHLYRRASREPWLLSIAHERYAALRLTPAELRDVQAQVPDLQLAIEDGP